MESLRNNDEVVEEVEREGIGRCDSTPVKADEEKVETPRKRRKTHRSYHLRTEHRQKLGRLLGKLMKCHDWDSASGVLSIVLKGLWRERSPVVNQKKYWATMELLNKIEGDPVNPRKIKQIYENLMRNNATTKNPLKDKYSIQLDYILYSLTHGQVEDARQAVICLLPEAEHMRDPIISMMFGLMLYDLWYSSIPEEMKLGSFDTYCRPSSLDVTGIESYNPSENLEGRNSVDVEDVISPMRCDSYTSVGNDKRLSIEMEGDLQRKQTESKLQPWGFYVQESAEINENERSYSDHGANLVVNSIFNCRGLDASLLPIRLPDSKENMGSIESYVKKMNEFYANAIERFKFALHSTPPVLAATIPLIQLLLLGDQVKEALNELENLHHKSNAALPVRLRAILLECFDSKNSISLSTCYEDILMKDPTSVDCLMKLITMHKNGEYGVESMVEMIALHLDATYPSFNVWNDLATCLLQLSQSEVDQMSMNERVTDFVRKGISSFQEFPNAFIQEKSKTLWLLRCRWWSARHFSICTFISELEACDLQLLVAKAVCASHLYGPDFQYVARVCTHLEKEDHRDGMSYLKTQMKKSVNLFKNLNRTT
ncbi:hypothetical protein Scep_026022 [Stephania cephalantha]|uniref:Uncharacterized protein n=1 Tax=Stephania cephalantha TaxID=152367 RepID=A0AAP0ERK5_9MAGN